MSSIAKVFGSESSRRNLGFSEFAKRQRSSKTENASLADGLNRTGLPSGSVVCIPSVGSEDSSRRSSSRTLSTTNISNCRKVAPAVEETTAIFDS